jgi:hypothetical protein
VLDDDGRRVLYEILDLDKHMDSSEMTPSGELLYNILEWLCTEGKSG